MSSHLLFLLGTFFLFIVLRVPVAFALGLSSLLTVIQLGLPFTSIVNQMFSGINSFPLLAVPFFLLLGRLMNDGGITDRLMKVSEYPDGRLWRNGATFHRRALFDRYRPRYPDRYCPDALHLLPGAKTKLPFSGEKGIS